MSRPVAATSTVFAFVLVSLLANNGRAITVYSDRETAIKVARAYDEAGCACVIRGSSGDRAIRLFAADQAIRNAPTAAGKDAAREDLARIFDAA